MLFPQKPPFFRLLQNNLRLKRWRIEFHLKCWVNSFDMLNKNCYRWSREICRDCFNSIASAKILIPRTNDSMRFNWSNTSIWKRIQLYSVGLKPKDSWMWVYCLLHFRTSCKSFITMSCVCLIKCTYGFNWANIGIFFTVPFYFGDISCLSSVSVW